MAMKHFVCFCGAAPVADDEAAAAAAEAARHRGKGKRARSLPSSFRWKKLFLPGKKGKKRSSVTAPPPSVAEAKKRWVDDEDDGWHDAYSGVFGEFAASSSTSSSLYSCSCAPSTSARSSTASSSPPIVSPPPAPERPQKGSSPAPGAAAVVLCLLMVVFCGRIGATLLTSTALYLFPRRWRGDDALNSLECDAEEDAFQANRRRVLVEKFMLSEPQEQLN